MHITYFRVPEQIQSSAITPEKESDGRYSCPQCTASYTRSNKLKMHMLDKHNFLMTEKHNFFCDQQGCIESFFTKTKLIEHKKNEHQVKYKEATMTFPSMKEFFEWKEREELQNCVYFTKQQGDTKTELSRNIYFYCQYDGHDKTHRKSDEPLRKTNKKFKRGRIKTGNFCPARMFVCKNKFTNEVSVHYISSHSHTVSLENTKFHPMPVSMKNEVKAKLSLGVPIADIYKDLRSNLASRDNRNTEMENVTKEHLVKKSNITDLKRHLGYNRRLHPDDSTSTYLLVQKLAKESYNPIVVYKPQGKDVIIGPTVYNDMDVGKNMFVIGIQTKEQRDMFIEGAKKIVCIDSTHKTNQYGFPLVNILVPDKFGKGYPVAHLISNHADEMTLTPFLEEIKSRCPPETKVQCVMTDDDNSGWNAITSVFGEAKHLLCKWHINCAWKRKLPLVPKYLQEDIYDALYALINEHDQQIFQQMLQSFLETYSLPASKFVEYFKNYYMDRCEKWAMCYRYVVCTFLF